MSVTAKMMTVQHSSKWPANVCMRCPTGWLRHVKCQIVACHPLNPCLSHLQSCSSSTGCDALSWSVPAASALCCWTRRGVASLSVPRTSCCHCRWTISRSRNTRLVKSKVGTICRSADIIIRHRLRSSCVSVLLNRS